MLGSITFILPLHFTYTLHIQIYIYIYTGCSAEGSACREDSGAAASEACGSFRRIVVIITILIMIIMIIIKVTVSKYK